MDNDLYHGRGMLARILQAIGNTDSLVWINLVPELMPPSWRSGGLCSPGRLKQMAPVMDTVYSKCLSFACSLPRLQRHIERHAARLKSNRRRSM